MTQTPVFLGKGLHSVSKRLQLFAKLPIFSTRLLRNVCKLFRSRGFDTESRQGLTQSELDAAQITVYERLSYSF